jgi:hypothetical protein
MSLGPSISIFGNKHSHVLAGLLRLDLGIDRFQHPPKKGLAGKYYDVKLIAFFLLLILGIVGVWKYTVYITLH